MESFAFGPGTVQVADDGAVAQVLHPDGRRVLLGDGPDSVVHDSLHAWGKGFVITDRGAFRFDSPAFTRWRSSGIDLLYQFGELELRVGRRFGERWTETYELRNTGSGPVEIGSVAVSTPYRDVYTSSRESLTGAVHAHVWTGGADAWVWAVPMDGSGPGLGLQLEEGELWAYSVESREPGTSSNIRGHIYLHVTDQARAPHAMGGQPAITLAPGASYRWTWQLAWYDDLPAFHADREPLIDADRLTAEVNEPIRLRDGREITSSEPGIQYVDAPGGRSRIAVLFHEPLRVIAERRARFVLDHQRRPELPDSRRYAFVPFDNDSGLTVLSSAWRDWSDARERVGMALLLQEVRDRGWGDRAELDEALAGYEQFVREHLLDDQGTIQDDSIHQNAVRLYNFPWFARFLLGQGDRAGATRILNRYYELGGDHFLAFDLGPLLSELGLHDHLVRHAKTFIGYGDELPPHEVNYEQSMVAPLLELLASAYRVAPGEIDGAELTRRLPWLTAFAADQPDVRLRHVPIRHWDGYWFGRLRLWGDVFPHYWSALSAVVYAAWPRDLVTPADAAWLDRAEDAILHANLVSFAADGSATCAFVYPSCVNGQPAHIADPLANDQDWALVYALRQLS
ncbi:hypothetical protein [Kribbella shirazensis]|uniref:Uncharacterized protein n=1 Tax=Kribbella shirazensis TaxID=1105143 RepID=A0A7X5VB57_9ACTN|nr:hypothetical protein [Kribbella shirazensis]NIK57779.1 hypothetical protein [Kribbella shirazensis]